MFWLETTSIRRGLSSSVRVSADHQRLYSNRTKKSRISLLELHVLPQLQLDVITVISRQPQAHLKLASGGSADRLYVRSTPPWGIILFVMVVFGHCASIPPSDPVSSSSTPCSLSVSHPAASSTSQIFHCQPAGPGAPQAKNFVVQAEIVLEFLSGRWLFDFAVTQHRPRPLRWSGAGLLSSTKTQYRP